VGRVNFLDDPTQTPHLTLDQFSEGERGSTKSSLSRKSRIIAEAIDTRGVRPRSTAGGPWPRRVPRRGSSSVDGLNRRCTGCCNPPSCRRKPGAWALSRTSSKGERVAQGPRTTPASTPQTGPPRIGSGPGSHRGPGSRSVPTPGATAWTGYTAHSELTALGVTLPGVDARWPSARRQFQDPTRAAP